MPKNIQNLFYALEKYSQGVLGISAQHIESGQSIEFNAEQRFLMCSTYKVAIAIYLFRWSKKKD